MLDRDAQIAVNECCPKKLNFKDDGSPARMAPSPETDTAPKAPDKPKHGTAATKEKNKDDKTLSDLNDGELKGLLDEALNYKNPKDREGKSKLFNHLLNEAEEDERNARAARAGGSELVRYCNPSAKRNSRHRKKPSSISENMMHGGSLDNLAVKDELLFETSKQRTKKSVSARQREGGSLPCNVNSTLITNHHESSYQFLEEARKKKEMNEMMKNNNVNNIVDVEAQSLLEHDSLAQNYQEQTNDIAAAHHPVASYKYTTRASFQVNVSEIGDIDRNRTVEKKGLHPRVPVFHVFMSRGGPDYEVDGPIQIPHLDQDRKNSISTKVNNQVVGTDCAGAIRISSEGKVDENGNALHQNSVKTKKKKILTDKNVTVCSAENVEGHRSDIIHDVNKLVEFIGTTTKEQHTEKNNRSIKSKLNRHSSDDNNTTSTTKSKSKRANSSKSKDNSNNQRSKLKKSNSLSEISTTKTNLDDFEFNNSDQVVMRNNNNNSKNNNSERPRERRSWGNMEPISMVQNLYNNASAENLESAEFRVVTKKKKSKKRRNSISGRSKTSSNVTGKMNARGQSPDGLKRRKSACSVPHSEKSNDSSDVDSVHSLPIDTQSRLDLATARLNMPISYADMAKNNDKPKDKEKKLSVSLSLITDNSKVPKDNNLMTDLNQMCDYNNKTTINNNNNNNNFELLQQSSNVSNSVKNIAAPPDVHNIKNFPAIPSTKQIIVQVNVGEKTSAAIVAAKNSNSNKINKNVKNDKNVTCVEDRQNHNNNIIHNEISMLNQELDGDSMHYSYSLPPDIPDVQTIEKMQLIGQGHPPPLSNNCYDSTTITNSIAITTTMIMNNGNNINIHNNDSSSNNLVDCDNLSERTSRPPPVVILSGYDNSKEVPGLVFGFDINEQLLNEDNDNQDFCCDDFVSRYIAPDVYTTTSHNHDKIVNFIGSAWEEAVVNLSNGKVQYYSDIL